MGYDTTLASVHDSQRGSELIDNNDVKGEGSWLDAGYVGTESKFEKIICEKGYGGHPLNAEQRLNIV